MLLRKVVYLSQIVASAWGDWSSPKVEQSPLKGSALCSEVLVRRYRNCTADPSPSAECYKGQKQHYEGRWTACNLQVGSDSINVDGNITSEYSRDGQ